MVSAIAKRLRAELFPSRAIPNRSVPELRAEESRRSRETEQPPVGVTVIRREIAGLSAEWIQSSNANSDAILYLHGGGFVLGSCSTHRNLTSRLALTARCRVVVPEYRLAPEHPFPASLEDAMAVYYELLRAGTDPRKLVIMGDSAGGGLCAALLLAIRDAGCQMPAAAVLISPWTDLTLSGDTYRTRADQDPLDRISELRRMADLYLCGGDATNPLVSPIFGNLRGLPKTLIQVGDHEVLLADSIRFFERAKQESVEVQIEIWPEMWHGWHMCAPALPEANEAIRHIGMFVRKATSGVDEVPKS